MGKNKKHDLIGKNVCEICVHYEFESKFCRKLLVMKPNGQYDYCKAFNQIKQKKEVVVVSKSEDVSNEDKALLEEFKDTLCISCQFINIQTQLCKKFQTLAKVRTNSFCKGYKEKQEKTKKGKGKNGKVKAPSVKLLGEEMCIACQFSDSDFCNKFLTFKKLKPTEVCKGFKNDKKKTVKPSVPAPLSTQKSDKKKSKKDDRINKIAGVLGKPIKPGIEIKKDQARIDKVAGALGKKDGNAKPKIRAPPGSKSQSVCNICQHCELESSFCKKFLSFRKLGPEQSCKGFKKIKK